MISYCTVSSFHKENTPKGIYGFDVKLEIFSIASYTANVFYLSALKDIEGLLQFTEAHVQASSLWEFALLGVVFANCSKSEQTF